MATAESPATLRQAVAVPVAVELPPELPQRATGTASSACHCHKLLAISPPLSQLVTFSQSRDLAERNSFVSKHRGRAAGVARQFAFIALQNWSFCYSSSLSSVVLMFICFNPHGSDRTPGLLWLKSV
ncbi:hypothetical protein AMECASPLE_032764 [Ameca splendens]|uniref:Uncharacterized protein n=1 Tax=Ameca splendens TaxID=208324 RepID=A0ABV0ZFR9_9TELE